MSKSKCVHMTYIFIIYIYDFSLLDLNSYLENKTKH